MNCSGRSNIYTLEADFFFLPLILIFAVNVCKQLPGLAAVPPNTCAD